MHTFIKAIEIWAPAKNHSCLEFDSGHYGEMTEFKAVSQQTRFNYNEGLPGKAWAAGHPLVISDLAASPYFQRKEAARESGLTAGIAVPLFAGDCLVSVVVFLCGDDEDNVGAIEVWHCDEEKSYDLELNDGYFGRLEHFEHISRHTSFRKGTGLPGLVWESGMPVLLNDLGKSHSFIRSEGASKSGMTAGIAWPVSKDKGLVYIMAFLSAKGTPIARQIELWVPEASRKSLVFQSGFTSETKELEEEYKGSIVEKGDGPIGRAFQTGFPQIQLYDESENSTGLVTLPVLDNSYCIGVICLKC